MVFLLHLDLLYLCCNGIVIGRSWYIADDTEGNGEAVAIAHEGELQLECVVLAVGVMNEDVIQGVAILTDFHDLESEALLDKAKLVVLTEDEGLAMADIDGIPRARFLIINNIVRTIIKDNAVLKNLADAGPFVGMGGLQHLNGAWGIGSHGAGEEVTAGTKAEFSGAERILDGAVGAGLGDKASGRGGAVLTLRETVDTVVQQNHVEIDVATVSVDEMVSADGKTVTVAANLPHVELGVSHLSARGDSRGTAMDGVHAVCGHVMGQTAAAADTANDGDVLGSHADFCQSLV